MGAARGPPAAAGALLGKMQMQPAGRVNKVGWSWRAGGLEGWRAALGLAVKALAHPSHASLPLP